MTRVVFWGILAGRSGRCGAGMPPDHGRDRPRGRDEGPARVVCVVGRRQDLDGERTENMDWISRVLRRLIEFTQSGGRGEHRGHGHQRRAQPYWNAEATMLMHTRGILIMMPESAMVLTGKMALDYSGSVSAEDNIGIGGYEHIMGPTVRRSTSARTCARPCRS